MSSEMVGAASAFLGSPTGLPSALSVASARDAVLYEVRFRTTLLSRFRPLRACPERAVAANSVCPVGLAVFPCPRWTLRSLLAHLSSLLTLLHCLRFVPAS